MSLRVGVLVSGEGSNLQALIDTVHGDGAVEIVGVASSRPDARGLRRAEAAGIATAVFQKADYPDRAQRDEALAEWLESLDVGLVVLAGFMELLREGFMRRFAGRVVNVHPSLLPAFPGLHPIQEAIDYGVRVMGVTVHFVDEGVDTGPILLQASIELAEASDAAAVHAALRPLEHRLLPEAVRLLAAGAVRRDPANARRLLLG